MAGSTSIHVSPEQGISLLVEINLFLYERRGLYLVIVFV